MKKSAFLAKNTEELTRLLETHQRRIATAKSCVDCSVPNSLMKHVKRRPLARAHKTVPDKKARTKVGCTTLQAVDPDGLLQRKESVGYDSTENGGTTVETSFALNMRTPYCEYLDLDSCSVRSRLYQTKTGKLTAHTRCSQNRDVFSTPPWKPPGISPSSASKRPYLDASSPSLRTSSNAKPEIREHQKTTPPSASFSCTHEAVPNRIPTLDETYQHAPNEKKVSFVTSLLLSPEGMPCCCVRDSHLDSVSSPAESLSLEQTPICNVDMECPEGTPAHSESPSADGSTPENSAPSSPYKSTSLMSSPTFVETSSSPEGNSKYTVASNKDDWVSETAVLRQCTDELLKQLEEAKTRMAARQKESQYLDFMCQVTQDILSRRVLSKAALEVVFRSHVESKCHLLDREVLLQKIEALKRQLGIAE